VLKRWLSEPPGTATRIAAAFVGVAVFAFGVFTVGILPMAIGVVVMPLLILRDNRKRANP
jgi:hypothetical protein